MKLSRPQKAFHKPQNLRRRARGSVFREGWARARPMLHGGGIAPHECCWAVSMPELPPPPPSAHVNAHSPKRPTPTKPQMQP